MSRNSYNFTESEGPYFITNVIVSWLPVFSNPANAEIILDSWKYLQTKMNVSIYGYVIMENHIHWIASGEDIREKVRKFKSFTARQIIDGLKDRRNASVLKLLEYFKLPHKAAQEYQLWQEGSNPKLINSVEMLKQKLVYIHDNPVKRGYVDEPEHWRYSSAVNYAGRDGLLSVDLDW